MKEQTSREVMLDCIAKGVVPIPIAETVVGKLVCKPTLDRWKKTPGFPVIQIGRRWYSTNEALSHWMANTKLYGGEPLTPSSLEVDAPFDNDEPVEQVEEPSQEAEADEHEFL